MPASQLVQRAAKSAALLPGLVRVGRPSLVVLLYHRVGEGDRSIDLPAERFARQLEYLSERAEVVGLAEGLARAADPGLERDLVVLTFDDGTEDFHTHALPLLERYRMPAILYLSTGPVHEGMRFPSWAGGTVDARAVSWTQVREAVATGLVVIGSHTHSHADLDRLAPPEVDDELRRSRELIEEHTGQACPDFAYPHALTSGHAEEAVRRHYVTAAIGGWRTNRAGRIDPYRISRIPLSRADGDVFFRAKVRGRMRAEALLYRIGGTRRG